jgi:quercetin dioxygenase-like cupin family protein
MPPSEIFEAAGIKCQFLITGEDTDGKVSVFRATIEPNLKSPLVPHSHDTWEETNIGIRGVMTFTVDGKVVEFGPGEAMVIPRGAVHGFTNKRSEEAEFLSVSTPAHFSPAYFREIGEVLKAADGGAPDRAAMIEVMKRHGLTPAVPAG